MRWHLHSGQLPLKALTRFTSILFYKACHTKKKTQLNELVDVMFRQAFWKYAHRICDRCLCNICRIPQIVQRTQTRNKYRSRACCPSLMKREWLLLSVILTKPKVCNISTHPSSSPLFMTRTMSRRFPSDKLII